MKTNIAHKLNTELQPNEKPTSNPKRINNPRSSTYRITKGEKVLYYFFALMLFWCSIQLLALQGNTHKVSIEIAELNEKVAKQQKTNIELSMAKGELESFERIIVIARKHGLEIRPKNIKVVLSSND